jgi:hypothetical protein
MGSVPWKDIILVHSRYLLVYEYKAIMQVVPKLLSLGHALQICSFMCKINQTPPYGDCDITGTTYRSNENGST